MKTLLLVMMTVLSLQAFASENLAEKKQLNFFPETLGFADKTPTGFLKVVGGKLSGFAKVSSERDKILAAYPVIEAVLNSEEFKQKVINFKDSTGKRSYTSNRGMTNEQIYEFLMTGNELLGGQQTLGEMNFDVQRYSRWWSKVIGYTSPGKSNTIFVNSKFYSGFKISQIASNLTHEWIHLNGFTHDSARDHDSVPYAVGYIVEALAEKYLKQGFLD